MEDIYTHVNTHTYIYTHTHAYTIPAYVYFPDLSTIVIYRVCPMLRVSFVANNYCGYSIPLELSI